MTTLLLKLCLNTVVRVGTAAAVAACTLHNCHSCSSCKHLKAAQSLACWVDGEVLTAARLQGLQLVGHGSDPKPNRVGPGGDRGSSIGTYSKVCGERLPAWPVHAAACLTALLAGWPAWLGLAWPALLCCCGLQYPAIQRLLGRTAAAQAVQAASSNDRPLCRKLPPYGLPWRSLPGSIRL